MGSEANDIGEEQGASEGAMALRPERRGPRRWTTPPSEDEQRIAEMRKAEDRAYAEWVRASNAFDKAEAHRAYAVDRAELSVRKHMAPYSARRFAAIERKIEDGDVHAFWGRRASDIAPVRRQLPEVHAARARLAVVVAREDAAWVAAWNRRAAAVSALLAASGYPEVLTGVPRALLHRMKVRRDSAPAPVRKGPDGGAE